MNPRGSWGVLFQGNTTIHGLADCRKASAPQKPAHSGTTISTFCYPNLLPSSPRFQGKREDVFRLFKTSSQDRISRTTEIRKPKPGSIRPTAVEESAQSFSHRVSSSHLDRNSSNNRYRCGFAQ
jgi:hypothetical protein